MWILTIVNTIGTIIGSWLDKKRIEAEGKIKIAQAETEMRIAKLNSDITLDSSSATDMKFSWKDEWFVILLSYPFIAAFIPPLQPSVRAGFQFLNECTPDWYQWAFLGAIAASFGLRTWTGWKR